MRFDRSIAAALAVAALVIGSASAASAQLDKLKQTTPGERAEIQTEIMTKKLGLTPAESGQIAALNLTYAQKMEPVIKGNQGPLMELREAKQIETEKEAALQKVLTPAQFGAYMEGKEEIKQKFEAKIAEKHP